MPERVLVVEDESVVQLHLCAIVERIGYQVSGAVRSAAEALESARLNPPDLVLMDIRLEGETDGIAAMQAIRAQRPVPVVYITAYADEATLARARATEPAAYLVKPFSQESVRATLATALAKDHALQELRQRERWLMTVLDSLGAGALVVDERGEVCFLSEPTALLLGVAADGARGQRWDELLGLDPAARRQVQEMLGRERAGRRRVAARLTRGERELWFDIDVLDSPGDATRRILFLYETSEVQELRRLLHEQGSYQGMVARSEAMRRVFDQVREVAAVDWNVLIEGETGTGKELVARDIHAASRRHAGPFVPVNCAGLTESLVGSQLFGHRRGAFTGAVADQLGLCEAAHGGTLFLDEIGDVPASVQTTLLRFLEDRQVTPVGATASRAVDARLLAATHRDLQAELEAGRFRADLLYRVRAVRIRLPPLRERGEDLPLLLHWFLDRARALSGKPVERFSSEALRALQRHAWPGNVRELRSAVDYALIQCRGSEIGPADLPPEVREPGPPAAGEANPLQNALQRTGGNRTRAAKLLGIGRATFYRRLRASGAGPDDEGSGGSEP